MGRKLVCLRCGRKCWWPNRGFSGRMRRDEYEGQQRPGGACLCHPKEFGLDPVDNQRESLRVLSMRGT